MHHSATLRSHFRSATGRQELDLPRLLARIASFFELEFCLRHLFFHYGLAPNTPQCIEGAPQALHSIIIAIIRHSLRSLHKGGITLQIRADRWNGTGKKALKVVVIDTGLGLTPGRLGRLTEPDNPTTDEDHTVHHDRRLVKTRTLLRRLGGNLSIYSIVGWGTRYVATLPLAEHTHRLFQ